MFGDANFKNRYHKISRRRFVQGLVAGGVVASFDLWHERRSALGHGRLGPSFRVESARIAMNPPIPREVSDASAPPVIAASR
jgi:hypothetical protein